MLEFLKNHPFAVEAFFERSIVLTFAVPKEQIRDLLPPCLEPDTFNDQWAFLAVAMVQTKDLRPKGFPKLLGNDFFLIGYRLFVQYRSRNGKRLRGLYILKSETDRKKMQLFGNLFTHYNYTTTDIRMKEQDGLVKISSNGSEFKVTVGRPDMVNVPLPAGSPFSNWKEARRFAGPLPFTFTYNKETRTVLIIEGVRENWTPKPLPVVDYDFSFLRKMNLETATLANAFVAENIPYHWKRGKKELWKQS